MSWRWVHCPLCFRFMKFNRKAEGYECTPCLEAAWARGWNEHGQADLFGVESEPV